MRIPPAATPRVMLLSALALALAGCANASSSPSTASDAVKVPFTSAAVSGHVLPATYTCDGKNINPPLEWGTVPADTGELVLVAVGLTPAAKNSSYTATIEWAIAGVNPALHKLGAGEIPAGAHVGLSSHNKRHYSLCPKKGQTEQYQFMLYGVPAADRVSSDFADQPILSALSRPGTSTSATAEGAFLTHYTRK